MVRFIVMFSIDGIKSDTMLPNTIDRGHGGEVKGRWSCAFLNGILDVHVEVPSCFMLLHKSILRPKNSQRCGLFNVKRKQYVLLMKELLNSFNY